MKDIYVECKADETLVKKFGFTVAKIKHVDGVTRILTKLKVVQNVIALIDEDPTRHKEDYEKNLTLVQEAEGIKHLTDTKGNEIFCLKGKLENWIVEACKKEKIKLAKYGLIDDPDKLHKLINYRLNNFEKLLDAMLEQKNPALLKLQSWLKG